MGRGTADAGTGNQVTASQAEHTASAAAPDKIGDWVEALEAQNQARPPEATAATQQDTQQPDSSAEGAQDAGNDQLAKLLPQKPDDAANADVATEGEGQSEGDHKPLELAFPEGFVRDEEMLGEFQAVAKEAGIKQEVAQKIADIYVAGQKKITDAFMTEHQKVRERIDKQWIAENHADPEFGGDNFEASNNELIKAIRHFVPPEEMHTRDGKLGFLDFFAQANLRNCPQLRRFFIRVGKYISEAGPVTSDASNASKDRSGADRMFPNLPSGIR